MKTELLLLIFLFSLKGLSQSGTLDTTFNNNGKVHTGFGISNAKANAVAVQPDGKIIVGGFAYTANTFSWQVDTNNAVLVRYNVDGSLDTTFGYEGKVMTDMYAFNNAPNWHSGVLSIKLLPDGKILTYEFKLLGYVPDTVLGRYNADGSIDTTFGTNGKVNCGSSSIPGDNSLIIQPDDKILVLGRYILQPTPGVYVYYFVVERYNPDGSYDTFFGTEGKQLTAIGSGGAAPSAIALQHDGKILVVGGGSNNFAMARYTSDGALDSTFDSDGTLTTSFGTGMYSSANFVTSDPNGKILVAGTTSSTAGHYFAMAKYNSNGTLDTSFDTDGKATTLFDIDDTSFYISSVVKQPDGKLLVTTTADAYDSYDSADDFVIRRYNSNATPDSSFGTNGKVATTLQTGYNISKNIAIQPDAKILVAGSSHPLLSEQNDFNVVRYDDTGNLDTAFNSTGMANAVFDSSKDEGRFLLIQPDNKLITIGTKMNYLPTGLSTLQIAMSKYNADGSMDSSFGTDGKVVCMLDGYYQVTNAVIQPDGKIIISCTYNNPLVDNLNHYELIRYTANGVIDTTYGTDGKVTVDAETTTLICQADGKIIRILLYYDDQSNPFLVLKRYTTDGAPDITFDSDGTASISGYYAFPSAAIQADGKIVVVASSFDVNGNSGFVIKRFSINGSLDNDFESGFTAVQLSFKAVFIQPDGKMMVAGRNMIFSDGFESYYFLMARYNSDGSIDNTYGTNGIIKPYLGNYYSWSYSIVQSVVLQPDGKFVVALSKPEQNPTSPNPNSYDFVVNRYNADGTNDNDFGTNGQTNTSFYTKYDEAFSMVLQSDNKIVVAGTTDTGINRDFALVRFNNVVLSVPEFGDNSPASNFIIYPNPTKDILNIKSENDNLQIIDYKISNMLGQIVHEGSQKERTIDTRNFSRGIYMIAIKTSKGVVTKKFIKE